MNNLVTIEKIQMTSRELAQLTGKRHADVMRDIRNEVDNIGQEIGQRIFAQSYYTNTQNKKQPCYILGKKGAMQLALKYDAVTRYKVINKLEELEEAAKPTGENLLALAVIEAHKLLDQKDRTISELKPKALFADAVSASEDTILIRELAKLLKQNGVDTGEKRLFEWLRRHGYLIQRSGSDYNMPTQRSMEMGLFRIKESTIRRSNYDAITRTAKVTGKGQQYFINKLCIPKIKGMEIY